MPASLTITSAAFGQDQRIPARYTADGADVSPPLSWANVPQGTVSLLLIMDDPDAPGGTFTHWLIYNLPADRTELPENLAPQRELEHLGGAMQGVNDFGRIGYRGPAPPPGPQHHYRFRLYALDRKLEVPPGARRSQLDQALGQAHLLAEGALVGTYAR